MSDFALTKAVREAIAQDLRMYWDSKSYGHIDLMAVTYIFENGTVRNRKLWGTYSEGQARNVDAAVRAQGGDLRDGLLQRFLDERQRMRDEIVDGLYGRAVRR